MNQKLKSYIFLHLAVLLYGFTAILGDLISLSAISLVWWRVLITSISLFILLKLRGSVWTIHRKLVLIYLGIGFIVAVHWISFYGAIKLANASVVLAAMASTSFFTSILEPLINKRKFKSLEIVLGLFIIPPLLLISNSIDLSLKVGFFVALLSAFLASLFASLNKKYIELAGSVQISFLEMLGALILISIVLPFFIDNPERLMPLPTDWMYLIVLSLLCTTFAYVISMKALRHVSAFDANLVINLEPVYGIILAIVILKDHQELNLTFYAAVMIILTIVFAHPFLEYKFYGRKNI